MLKQIKLKQLGCKEYDATLKLKPLTVFTNNSYTKENDLLKLCCLARYIDLDQIHEDYQIYYTNYDELDLYCNKNIIKNYINQIDTCKFNFKIITKHFNLKNKVKVGNGKLSYKDNKDIWECSFLGEEKLNTNPAFNYYFIPKEVQREENITLHNIKSRENKDFDSYLLNKLYEIKNNTTLFIPTIKGNSKILFDELNSWILKIFDFEIDIIENDKKVPILYKKLKNGILEHIRFNENIALKKIVLILYKILIADEDISIIIEEIDENLDDKQKQILIEILIHYTHEKNKQIIISSYSYFALAIHDKLNQTSNLSRIFTKRSIKYLLEYKSAK